MKICFYTSILKNFLLYLKSLFIFGPIQKYKIEFFSEFAKSYLKNIVKLSVKLTVIYNADLTNFL